MPHVPPPPRILVVDDDAELRGLVVGFMQGNGLEARGVRDGIEMQAALARESFDLTVLDVMLPGEDGISLLRRLRTHSALPVILLTAKGEESDRIVGLELGADDYLAKPFNPRELLARIRAVLRRGAAMESAPHEAQGFAFVGWRLDPLRRELFRPDGVLVDLSAGEYDLLLALLEAPNRILTREYLLDAARGREAVPFDRSIDVQLSRLRRKIEPDENAPDLIKTVRGAGYMFLPKVTRL